MTHTRNKQHRGPKDRIASANDDLGRNFSFWREQLQLSRIKYKTLMMLLDTTPPHPHTKCFLIKVHQISFCTADGY